MLTPSSAMIEDPATGPLNSAPAHWLQAGGRLTRSISMAQGTFIGRRGRVAVGPLGARGVSIGGQTHIFIDGIVTMQAARND